MRTLEAMGRPMIVVITPLHSHLTMVGQEGLLRDLYPGPPFPRRSPVNCEPSGQSYRCKSLRCRPGEKQAVTSAQLVRVLQSELEPG